MEVDISPVLASLNEKQKQAVTFPSSGRLQIIAGPGTGKTKVLISRVAKLLLVDKIEPYKLIVTTFTKKAANEMVERLTPILKGTSIDPNKILIGTFHSICYRIIRRYGNKLGLNNYTIADERDSNQILQEIFKELKPDEIDHLDMLDDNLIFKTGKDGKYHGYDPKIFKRQISKLKSSGITLEKYLTSPSNNKTLRFIYEKYQLQLKKEFLLDFDDCLLECYELISTYQVLNFVEHVLVDEFQDTNEIQLQLMYEFAKGHPKEQLLQHNVTIVGDSDQSIYAFRDAQSINFDKMKKYYESVKSLSVSNVTLNENYRSTKDILDISETIMRQQEGRSVKQLNSQLDKSFKPVHNVLNSAKQEAKWIAYQISYLTSLPNSVIKYQDIAILVRAAYQTRGIENELVKLKIPYYMIRGKAFWERKEVVAILDYLRIIANPLDRIAYIRTLNFPKRGIGEKSLQEINKKLDLIDLKTDTVHNGLKIIIEDLPKKGQRDKLLTYLSFIEESRRQLSLLEFDNQLDSESKLEILADFFEYVYINSGLKEHFKKDESHEQNIMEVQKQLLEFIPRDDEQWPMHLNENGEPVLEEEEVEDNQSYLSKFIVSLGLFEHTDDKDDEQGSNRVSLSTIHGSKGLEWPVVLIPGLSEGLLPAGFAIRTGTIEELDEERRCFYVAATRAKTLLYLSSYVESDQSNNWYSSRPTSVSRFITNLEHKFSNHPKFLKDWETLEILYNLRGIELPSKLFDLQLYYQGYKSQLSLFIEGEISRFKTIGYSPEESNINHYNYNNTINNMSVKTEDPKKVFGMGFSSSLSQARYELQKKRKVESHSSLPMSNAPSGSSLVKSLYASSAFKKHNPSKAPPYIPMKTKNVAPSYTRIKSETIAPKGNKAPAYIPDRKRFKQP